MKLSTSGVVREILTKDTEMDTGEVVRRAKARGVRVEDKKIRHAVHNLRNEVRAAVAGSAKLAPSAARETTPLRASEAVAAAAPAPDLAGVLANTALVNEIVGLCGGIENARRAVNAVEACGGVGAFLRHLEVVAIIRGSEPTA